MKSSRRCTGGILYIYSRKNLQIKEGVEITESTETDIEINTSDVSITTNRLSFMPPEFDEPTARHYYADKLANYKEVLLSKEVAAFTGYCPRTVTSWVNEKKLRAIILPERYIVPKEYLINFLVSDYYNKSIIKKSQKHFTVLWEIYNIRFWILVKNL